MILVSYKRRKRWLSYHIWYNLCYKKLWNIICRREYRIFSFLRRYYSGRILIDMWLGKFFDDRRKSTWLEMLKNELTKRDTSSFGTQKNYFWKHNGTKRIISKTPCIQRDQKKNAIRSWFRSASHVKSYVFFFFEDKFRINFIYNIFFFFAGCWRRRLWLQ